MNEQDKQEWARFMRCLRIHEQGHVDLPHDFISTLVSSERKVSGSEIVGKANFSNISALLYKLDRAQHSDLVLTIFLEVSI